MKSVFLFLFLICVYSIYTQGSNAILTNLKGLSGIIARDGLRKLASWRTRLDSGSIRSDRPLYRHSSNTFNHMTPLWTAGHKRIMSNSSIIPNLRSFNKTYQLHNGTANHSLNDTLLTLKQESTTVTHLTDSEEIKLINNFKKNQPKTSLKEMEHLDQKWNLGINT